ncbi:MAG: hypothetical protein ACI88A_000428 [Paraglaciecola sp.]|jgi:hypothetical protein
MTELNLLLFLILGHLICDFYLQPKTWVDNRNTLHHKSLQLAYHAVIHGLVTTSILLFLTDHAPLISFSLGIFVLLTHYIVDLTKSYCPNTVIFLVLDQIAHLIILLVVWFLLTGGFSEYKELLTLDKLQTKHVAILIAYLLVLKPTSIIITMTLKPWSEGIRGGNEANPESLDTGDFAGQRIGYLERILILTFIILNQFSAIGFLLAAKSIFRFGDLTKDEDKKLTEYVMLGTLTSFTITIIIGLTVATITANLPMGK